ncbi:glyoxalase superfamily protein [Paracoccus aminophilus]|uniref:Glyoxalase-related protein domain-containing protein n=1 Tax=Paracoccus aminophilus JCM 7686 TaxID=1367847 RepID=S5XTH1_PARAH|nr:glyoxalase superfamily protein [Paracoccus aminophilus]AGT10809.1 hypothetical protein JCM7686_pAMI4p118 [Paracoccus aminophilus JCM 7686]
MRSVAEAKEQAKALRAALEAEGVAINHAQSLEMVAKQNGARDWNTLHAQLMRNTPDPLRLNQRVRGRYLGQPFAGEIIAIAVMGQNYEVTIRFDEAVDVVESEHFSNFRRQIRAVVDLDGISPAKTSNGLAQLVVEPETR